MEKVLEISSRKFREEQKKYFELADLGTQIIIKRGNKTYAITPLSEEDLYFTPEVMERIKLSVQQAKEGKVLKMLPGESLTDFIARTENV